MVAEVIRLEERRQKPHVAEAPPPREPHEPAVEAAVLDALVNLPVPMAERRAACAFYTPEHFHVEANRLAFEAVAAMAAADIPVDAASVAARLHDKTPPDVPGGWAGYLRDVLCNQGGMTIEARREHARILDNLRRCRAIIRECDAISARARSGPPATALIEDAVGRLGGIVATKHGTARALADIAHDVFNRIASPQYRPFTGFKKLDRAIGQLLGGQVTVIAARPKAGKTNLAWHIAEKIVKAKPRVEGGCPDAVLFVTAEMSAEALYYRQLGIHARVHPDALQNGNIHDHQWDKLTDANKGWSNLPIILDDFGMTRPTVPSIEATFTRLRDQLAAGAYRNKFEYTYPRCALRTIIIDHLGKIASPRDNDHRAGDPQRLKASMEAVVDLAKHTDSHVILLWHAGMGDQDSTADLTPKDVRGTKDPEGSCDRMLFLTRPEPGRLKIAHYVDRHRSAAGYSDPIWLETEDGVIWEAADA